MPEKYWRVRPVEHHDWLPNPHKGCATFQHFAGDPLFPGGTWSEEGPLVFPERRYPGVTPGYLPSTIAYCRWFWEVFEPEEGRHDWSMIDRALETARARGQTLHVRLMPLGSSRQPQLPAWYREHAPCRKEGGKDGTQEVPVYDGEDYYRLWGRVIRAFAERYDGHPDLSFFDIAYVGPWGEGAGECSDAGIERMTGLYVEAFKRTPLCSMLGGLPVGVRLGTGWRCDCFGDQRRGTNEVIPPGRGWNHSFAYPRILHRFGASELWRRGPVVLETCHTPHYWFHGVGEYYDLDFTIGQGLKMHASEFMPKSTAIPEQWQDPLLDFCKRLGYRLVFRELVYEAAAARPDGFEYSIWIENVGVAPLYHDYAFVLKLVQDDREFLFEPKTDVRTWVPGDVILEGRMPVPTDFEEGWAGLFAGIVERESKQPRVRFAVREVEPDGWLRLDRVWLK